MNAATLYESGNVAYFGENGSIDYKTAFEAYTQATKLDPPYPLASYALGYMYDHGLYCTVDYTKALYYYTMAYDLCKVPSAAAAIAYLHYEGDGCDVNKVLARQWFDKAIEAGLKEHADNGDRHAMFWLANAYLDDDDLVEGGSLDLAFNLFSKAADAGYAEAMLMCSYMIRNRDEDQDQDQDLTLAFKYCEMAANKGHTTAITLLGDMYLYGIGCDVSSTKAMETFTYAYDKYNDTSALIRMATVYMNDEDQPNIPKGISLLEQAAQENNDEAMLMLASAYMGELHEDINEDLTQAITWLEKASQLNNSDALNQLGFMYITGTGVTKDITKGISLQEQSANLGNVDALLILGQMYHSGADGDVPINLTNALQYYHKAADRGSATAAHFLSEMYEQGEGVDIDQHKAKQWALRAQELESDSDWSDMECCPEDTCHEDGCHCHVDEEEIEE